MYQAIGEFNEVIYQGNEGNALVAACEYVADYADADSILELENMTNGDILVSCKDTMVSALVCDKSIHRSGWECKL
jgi:hypothetical protein